MNDKTKKKAVTFSPTAILVAKGSEPLVADRRNSDDFILADDGDEVRQVLERVVCKRT